MPCLTRCVVYESSMSSMKRGDDAPSRICPYVSQAVNRATMSTSCRPPVLAHLLTHRSPAC